MLIDNKIDTTLKKIACNKNYIFLTLSVFLILTAVLLSIYIKNDNKIIYTVDDSYIHMSIAKNLVENNVWGVTRYEAVSSSSSVLWTLILTTSYYIFGIKDFIPLVINFIVLFPLLYCVNKIFDLYSLSVKLKYVALLVVFGNSYFILVFFTGMEHILFTNLVILFLYYILKIIDNKNVNKAALLLITYFMCFTRFEGYVFLLIVAVIFLYKKLYREFRIIISAGIIAFITSSIILYFNTGSISATLEMKTRLGLIKNLDWNNIINSYNFYWNNLNYYYILTILILSVYLLYKYSEFPQIIYLKYFSGIIISYIVLCSVIYEPFNIRYVQILFFLWILFLIPVFIKFIYSKFNRKYIINSFLILIIILSAFRLYININRTVTSSYNIYSQQYQMAEFIKKYYNDDKIVINDIGLISYMTNAQIVDIVGLGNRETKKDDIYFGKNKLIMVYKEWLYKLGMNDTNWSKTAEWKISDNYICGDSIVTIYSQTNNIAKDNEDNLINNLRIFFNLEKQKLFQQVIFKNDKH